MGGPQAETDVKYTGGNLSPKTDEYDFGATTLSRKDPHHLRYDSWEQHLGQTIDG